MENEQAKYLGQATYCPEDNKLRFYPDERLSKEDYNIMRNAGFRWAPKQELFVKPRWTPQAEDLLLKWCGSIEDEDQTPEERSADRAERFEMYRDKRTGEAIYHADKFDSFGGVHGYQSEKKAGIEQRKEERQRVKAFTQWDKAEYWQQRTKGVICSALYKSTASVRRSRILKLESEQRKAKKEFDRITKQYELAQKAIEEENDELGMAVICDMSYALYMECRDNGARVQETLKKIKKPQGRVLKHLDLRLSYEKQMLEDQGGSAQDVEMKLGGFIGKYQIFKINKSPSTGKPTSISTYLLDRWNPERGEVLTTLSIRRLGDSVYREPTSEELEAYTKKVEEKKTISQANNAVKPKLINPTMEDAQRLQDIWNKGKKEKQTISPMTQAQYKNISGGSYSNAGTCEVLETGEEKSNHWNAPKKQNPVCKVRKCYKTRSCGWSNIAYSVIVIADKPQKALPEFRAVAVEVTA